MNITGFLNGKNARLFMQVSVHLSRTMTGVTGCRSCGTCWCLLKRVWGESPPSSWR